MAKTPVSILHELANKRNFELKYELLPLQNIEGQRNMFHFKVTAGNINEYGKGYSKQEAKHNSAIKVLKQLSNNDEYLDNQSQDITEQCEVVNTVGLLNKYVLENNYQLPIFKLVSEIGEPHSKIFTIECKVGTILSRGIDTTKKKAKFTAAKKMLNLLSKNEPDNTTEIISFHNLISCKNVPSQEDVMNFYNEKTLTKQKTTSCPSLISLYPQCFKRIMMEKDLIFDELWPCYKTEDFDQLENVLEKLDINMSVKFMQGCSGTIIAYISLDTKPEFTIAEFASTKMEALESAVKETIDFLKIMTQ